MPQAGVEPARHAASDCNVPGECQSPASTNSATEAPGFAPIGRGPRHIRPRPASIGLPPAQFGIGTRAISDWPSLPELFSAWYQGSETGRDPFLIDTDLDRLRARVDDYFDVRLSHEQIAERYPIVMKDTARFDAKATRDALLKRGGPIEAGFVRHAYRPFDSRWLYWEKDTKLLREKSPHYPEHVFEENLWFSAAQHLRRGAEEPQACFTSQLASRHLIERGTSMFPAWLRDEDMGSDGNTTRRANLTAAAQSYLDRLNASVEDLFHHVLAVLHDPSYRQANAGALRMEWPRIPLPGWPDGELEDAAESLTRSAALGRELARLLDPDVPVIGVTQLPLRADIAAIAVPATANGRNMAGEDFAITAGWGHHGPSDAVMPRKGSAVERAFTPKERAALSDALPQLGETTFDIHLNANAFWRNVPATVWQYKLGGYQVLKKWLSYREQSVLQRPSRPEEVQQFAEIARRIAAILMIASSPS